MNATAELMLAVIGVTVARSPLQHIDPDVSSTIATYLRQHRSGHARLCAGRGVWDRAGTRCSTYVGFLATRQRSTRRVIVASEGYGRFCGAGNHDAAPLASTDDGPVALHTCTSSTVIPGNAPLAVVMVEAPAVRLT